MGLRKVYTTEEVETTALDNVNLEIADGEFAAIMGPSGLRQVDAVKPSRPCSTTRPSGEYWLLNEEVSTYSERLRANLRKGTIGFVFQAYNLINELTVHENVELPPALHGTARAGSAGSGCGRSSTRCRSPHRGKHFPQQLSGRPAAAGGGGEGPGPPSRSWCSPTSRPATSTRGTETRSWRCSPG